MSMLLKDLKRVLRYSRNGENRHALLELGAISDENKDWSFHLARGRVLESLKRYPEAVGAYMQALIASNHLNSRNKAAILQKIVVHAANLSAHGKMELAKIWRQDDVFVRFIGDMPTPDVPLDMWHWVQTPHQAARGAQSTGRITNIGKYLLDQSDREKLKQILEQTSESRIRILRTWNEQPDSPQQ